LARDIKDAFCAALVLGVAAAVACEACMELAVEVCMGEMGFGFVFLLVVVESKPPLLLDVEMGEMAGRDLTDDVNPMAESGDASPLVSGFAIFNGPRDKSMTGMSQIRPSWPCLVTSDTG
jgi:hypothetical protein